MGKQYEDISQEQVSTAKIAVWYTIGNLFSKGVAFITTPIFTRLLSQSQFGEFSNFTSWLSIISILATFDFATSIMRAKYDYNEKMDQYLSSVTLFSNIITLIFYIIIECFSDYFCSLFNMDMIYIRFMFIYIIFYPAFSYMQVKHRAFRKYKFFVTLSISSVVLTTAFSVLLVLLMENKLFGRIVGYVIPVTIMNFCLWSYIIHKGRSFSLDCIKYACKISIPLIPHALSGILLGNSDRIMITQICGSEANAIYSLAYQISLLANVLWTSMNQAWAPWLYDQIHGKNYKAIRKKSKIYLGVFSILIIGVLLITPEIILIMGGRSYYDARYLMPPVILGCCFQFIYGMYVNIEIYEKKTILISIGTVGAALLNIGLNAIFIPKFGYAAAAYTTLVGYIALFSFHYLIVKVNIKYLSNIYEKRFILKIISGLSLASIISLLLFHFEEIRYILTVIYITIVIIFFIKNRELIIKIFKR